MKVAIITSQWHKEITDELTQNCTEELYRKFINQQSGLSPQKLSAMNLSRLEDIGKTVDFEVTHFQVPGSAELPFAAQNVILTTQPAAVIVIGVILKGATDHNVYVSQQASYGCQKIALKHNTPVIYGVMGVDSLDIAKERSSANKQNSGKEWAQCAIYMIKHYKS